MQPYELEERLKSIENQLEQIRGVKPSYYGSQDNGVEDLISFISPCYNESENLCELYKRITEVCAKNSIANYEIIWIENGSQDDSVQVMKNICSSDPRLRVIQLSRNFGYQGAISCGLIHSRGSWLAILDGDLQDPPEMIPEMLSLAINEKHDIIYGVRKKRKEGFMLRFAYALFYRIWKATADISVPLDAGDFCVMHRRVARAINSMPERQRFIRGLRAWVGFSQGQYVYHRESRYAGESKFNLKGMLSLALDGLISYSVLPLRVMIFLGAIVVSLAFVVSALQGLFRILAYAGLLTVSGILPPGLTQINVMLVGLIGLNILCVGVVGEYVGRIYNETKDRPLFIVKEIF